MGSYEMNRNEFVESWKYEEGQLLTGWDFSYLDGRMLEEQPPWSYSLRAAELLRQSASVLDLDSGGVEIKPLLASAPSGSYNTLVQRL